MRTSASELAWESLGWAATRRMRGLDARYMMASHDFAGGGEVPMPAMRRNHTK